MEIVVNDRMALEVEGGVYEVRNNEEFKKNNLWNWYDNTDFWLQSQMRHLRDVSDFTGTQIQELIKLCANRENPCLMDFGCGEGWILRLILEKELPLEYIGLDFNDKFIFYLKEKYAGSCNISFECMDFEKEPSVGFISKADIGLNFFNFFEIPNIEAAFRNVAKMLKSNSYLLIVSIDPVMQILSVSKSEEEFRTNLRLYEKYGTRLGYDKDIDVGDLKSNRIYKSLLYSTSTYVELAKQNNMQLVDYKEVVKTANTVPQIYQFIFFHKL